MERTQFGQLMAGLPWSVLVALRKEYALGQEQKSDDVILTFDGEEALTRDSLLTAIDARIEDYFSKPFKPYAAADASFLLQLQQETDFRNSFIQCVSQKVFESKQKWAELFNLSVDERIALLQKACLRQHHFKERKLYQKLSKALRTPYSDCEISAENLKQLRKKAEKSTNDRLDFVNKQLRKKAEKSTNDRLDFVKMIESILDGVSWLSFIRQEEQQAIELFNHQKTADTPHDSELEKAVNRGDIEDGNGCRIAFNQNINNTLASYCNNPVVLDFFIKFYSRLILLPAKMNETEGFAQKLLASNLNCVQKVSSESNGVHFSYLWEQDYTDPNHPDSGTEHCEIKTELCIREESPGQVSIKSSHKISTASLSGITFFGEYRDSPASSPGLSSSSISEDRRTPPPPASPMSPLSLTSTPTPT